MTASSFLEWLVSVSMQSGVLVILILGVKAVFNRLLTPWWHFALWLLVLARLVIPTGPESVLSLSNYVGPSRWAAQASDGPKSLRGFLPVNGGSEPEVDGGAAAQTEFKAAHAVPDTLIFSFDASAVVLVVWGLGILAALVLLAGNVVRLLATIQRARLIDDPEMLALFKGCCMDVGIHRRVELRQSDEVSTPVLAGLFRPVVLLPGGTLATTSAAELRFILLHELIHLRRGDLLVGCAAALLQAVHWFNPLIWIGFYRMRADREIACDAEVVKLLGRDRAADYGRTILKLAEHASVPRLFAGSIGIIEVKSEIGRRIIMISQHRKQGRVRAVCGLAIAVIIAAVSFTAAQSQPTGPETAVEAMRLSPRKEAVEGAPVEQPQQYSGTYSSSTATSIASVLEAANPKSMFEAAATTGVVYGKTPFKVTVDDKFGKLIYTFNEKTKQLETIAASKGVVMSMNGTTITCESLNYSTSNSEITATGPGLEVRMPDRTNVAVVSADALNYDVAEGSMDFTGNVQVVVKRPDERITKTTNQINQVTISTVDGKLWFSQNVGQSMEWEITQENR